MLKLPPKNDSITFRRLSPFSGVTLVELLVIVSIISVLLALFVVAIQYARESSRDIACSNSLRQIGLAVSNYESQHRCFPPASIHRLSSFVVLLPHLEQTSLFGKIDFNNPSEAMDSLATVKLSLLKCPSNSRTSHGVSDFVLCVGNGKFHGGFNGVFGTTSEQNSEFKIHAGMISDGLSNTIAISETGSGDSPNYRGRVWKIGANAIDKSHFFKLEQECLTKRGEPNGHNLIGTKWAFAGLGSGVLYTQLLPPNSPSCVFGDIVTNGIYSVSSEHPKKANALFADGSVRTQSNNINQSVWMSAGSRNSTEN